MSPSPPPSGGIAQWSYLVLQEAAGKRAISLLHVDSSQARRHLSGTSAIRRAVAGVAVLIRVFPKIFASLVCQLDVLHLTTSGHFGLIRDLVIIWLARLFRCPVVYHLHYGRIPAIVDAKNWEWYIQRLCVKLSSGVIAIDMITKQCLDTTIKNSAPIYYIPNPIDLTATNREASCLNEQHTLDYRYALYLGWVIPSKGIEELILAWNTTRHSDIRLVIAGPFDPTYVARLSALVSDNSVDFIGEVDHHRAMLILSKAEFLVLPSYSEGFPNVILEAMALRRAVLSTSVGAIPEMLSGGCGLVVEPRSAEALGPPLQKLIDNPMYTTLLGLNGFERCKNRYRIDTVFDMYLDVWNSLAGWKR